MKIIILILAILGVNSCFASAAAAVIVSAEDSKIPMLYRSSLPILELESDLTANGKSEAILEYLQLMGGGAALTGGGRDAYLSSLEESITGKTPIQMVMLGFPFKSGNLTKVLGQRFDM